MIRAIVLGGFLLISPQILAEPMVVLPAMPFPTPFDEESQKLSCDQYVSTLLGHRNQIRRQIREIESEVEQDFQSHVAALGGEKVIEKLKERRSVLRMLKELHGDYFATKSKVVREATEENYESQLSAIAASLFPGKTNAIKVDLSDAIGSIEIGDSGPTNLSVKFEYWAPHASRNPEKPASFHISIVSPHYRTEIKRLTYTVGDEITLRSFSGRSMSREYVIPYAWRENKLEEIEKKLVRCARDPVFLSRVSEGLKKRLVDFGAPSEESASGGRVDLSTGIYVEPAGAAGDDGNYNPSPAFEVEGAQ